MTETYANKTLAEMIEETGGRICDLARWPDSEATKESCDASIKALRKSFKAESYGRAFLYFAACQIAHDLWTNTVHRSVKSPGLKMAWMKIGELFD